MKKHILIIEDEKDIRECLCEYLEMEGYQITTAVHGADALLVAETFSELHLILLDRMMPVMNGDEFILKRETHNLLSAVPVILVTADIQTNKTAKALGVSDYLKKPMDLEDLTSIIKRHIL